MNDKTVSIDVVPSGAALGAEIKGLQLNVVMPESIFKAVRDAWHRHQVLLFRNQHLSDPELIAFSRQFGKLDLCPPNDLGRRHIPDRPEIVVVSNVVENGRRIGSLGNYEAHWHSDMTYLVEPPMASLLYSLEVPATGGDTAFANMYLAYNKLSDDLRREIAGLRLIHDGTYDSAGSPRKGIPEVSDVREAPGARHPLVRIHPATGQPALFLGRRRNGYLIGKSVADSERLLESLWAHATRPEFVCSHSWRVGDLLLWDNRCTMHRRDPFRDDSRRVMHRTQVGGEAVIAQ
jgi:alpha-ketoglutarate-dependent taurine dioxygenase